MGVDRKGRPVEAEKEDDGRRLGADAFDRGQPGLGPVDGPIGQKVETQVAALTGDCAQRLLDVGSFLVGQAGRPDGVDDQSGIGVTDLGPGGQSRPQALEGQIPVPVVGVLAQDRLHQLRDRIAMLGRLRLAVGLCQAAADLGHSEVHVVVHVGHGFCIVHDDLILVKSKIAPFEDKRV